MKEKNNDKRLINGYFEENLSKKEKEEFLERASSDKGFIKDFVDKLEKVAKGQDDAESGSTNDPEDEEEEHIDVPDKSTGRKKYILISSLAALLIMGIIIIQSVLLPSNNQIYKHFYQPINASNYITRSQSSIVKSEFQKGVELYYQGSYESAAELLEEFIHKGTPTQEIILFAGLSYMGLEEYHLAILSFLKAKENYQEVMPEISWYLALAYVKSGNRQQAKNTLRDLKMEGGMKGQNVDRLIKKLS